MRLLVLLAATLLAAGSASAATAPVHASMTTSSTNPVVDTPWRYTITVKDQAGKPLAAKVRLQILLGTFVVGCWKKGIGIVHCSGASAGDWIAFTGKRTGELRWPARWAGVKLTFQAIVVAGTRSLHLRAPVTVRLP